MYCAKCGKENPEGNRFCEYCGAEMIAPGKMPEGEEGLKEKRKRKAILLIILAILLIAGAAACVLVYMDGKNEAEYNARMEEAHEYMEDLDYGKAETAYLEAIEIEPKEEEPYLRLSEVYVAQDEDEKAIDILEEGQNAAEETGRIEERLDELKYGQMYYDYLKASFDPPFYDLADTGSISYDDKDVKLGLISAYLTDIDGDDIPEMITIDGNDRYVMSMKVSLYTIEDGQVVNVGSIDDGLGDDAAVMYDENNEYSGESEYCYIKEYEGNTYFVNVRKGISGGGSMSSESIDVVPVTKEGFAFEESCSVYSGVSRGNLLIEINGENVVEQYADDSFGGSAIVSSSNEAAWSAGEEAIKKALEKYGLDDKVYMETTEGSVSGSLWIGFSLWDKKDETEIPLSSREREWLGSVQSVTKDHTGIRDKLQ